MERLEISLEKLFDSIRQTAENIGNYDSYTEILTILSNQKSEFSETLSQTIEEFLLKELEEDVQEENTEFLDDEVFLLADDDDDDDEEDDEDEKGY
ncbi:hypothetical protein MZM54_01965 [[Brevibacterium] frigoritolerans]|nr:hypothetical protein [Peribacillus frigoritolerans]